MVVYQRARFVTQLPDDYRFHPSHFWLASLESGLWRVGFTKFALHRYGEMVEHDFQVQAGASVHFGQMIGWIEGFKATSDLDSVIEGQFCRGNPALREQLKILTEDPYGAGWLYQAKGQPDPNCVDVHAYVKILDRTIDQLLQASDGAPSE